MKQSGAALITSLLILLMLTILGISSMRTTTLEEKMTANTRDQQVAFQAAEAALRAGEAAAFTIAKNAASVTAIQADDDCLDDGLCNNVTTFDEFNPASWDNAPSVAFDLKKGESNNITANLPQRPKYIVQHLLPIGTGSGSASGGGGSRGPGVGVGYSPGTNRPASGQYGQHAFRVTARAVGPSGAPVVLQSTMLAE